MNFYKLGMQQALTLLGLVKIAGPLGGGLRDRAMAGAPGAWGSMGRPAVSPIPNAPQAPKLQGLQATTSGSKPGATPTAGPAMPTPVMKNTATPTAPTQNVGMKPGPTTTNPPTAASTSPPAGPVPTGMTPGNAPTQKAPDITPAAKGSDMPAAATASDFPGGGKPF